MSDDLYDVEAEEHEEDDFDAAPPPPARAGLMRGRGKPDTEVLLHRVLELVDAARPIPLSASAKINNKEEVMELLQEAIESLPTELRDARWLRKQREEYLAKMRVDGEELLDAARARAEQMVQRTEVVKAAEQRARHIVDRADAEARRLRLECEDYCDQRLAAFEIVLERTLNWVSAGREKLQATNVPMPPMDELDTENAFFDQDPS
ncbi:MAG: hypothetical protein GX643_09175 [Acidimicrobiales bacterium]|nr:hypothetical protein [Acidimicrobiales bacterium]